MKITVLIDNRPHPEHPALEVEHGLSFYLETAHGKWLLDVGASNLFLHNAARLGIDIAEVDGLILSHAHRDHTGGLAAFLQHNRQAPVYLSSHIDGKGYFSNRRGSMRDISIDYGLLEQYKERFIQISDDRQLNPSVRIISHIPAHHELPKANSTLFAGDAPDAFPHEMAVWLTEGKQSVLLSSCTHLGLLNTLEACTPATPSAFIGGLHLVDVDPSHAFETEEELHALGDVLLSRYPDLQIYTGHCTGQRAQSILSDRLKMQFHTFHTGYEWRFSD